MHIRRQIPQGNEQMLTTYTSLKINLLFDLTAHNTIHPGRPEISLLISLVMNAFNCANTMPMHPIPSHQISIMDAFLPGFTGISASIQQLLAGNTDGFAHLLCICGIFVFLVRYGYRYLIELVEAYFSS
jgi:hypothetical protein